LAYILDYRYNSHITLYLLAITIGIPFAVAPSNTLGSAQAVADNEAEFESSVVRSAGIPVAATTEQLDRRLTVLNSKMEGVRREFRSHPSEA
jgi:hypothetical protein